MEKEIKDDFKAVDYGKYIKSLVKTEVEPKKPREVFQKDDEWHIVTELINGRVSKTEKLRDYVARSYIMEFKGELLTINEILNQLCQGFINE